MRREIIAGNWKMFKTRDQTRKFFEVLLPEVQNVDHCDVIVAPPFTALATAVDAVAGSQVAIAAQDVHWETEGAYTGEVSAGMLREAGCQFTIIGHSERRQLFGETNATVSKKIAAVLAADMNAIVCVGETLEHRESGDAEKWVEAQLREGLGQLTASDLSHIIVAYEPVWAIGTGRTATPEIAGQMHASIRAVIAHMFGLTGAASMSVLYGGSVKPGNVAELMAQNDIDGALVGGASLEPESFAALVHYGRA